MQGVEHETYGLRNPLLRFVLAMKHFYIFLGEASLGEAERDTRRKYKCKSKFTKIEIVTNCIKILSVNRVCVPQA